MTIKMPHWPIPIERKKTYDLNTMAILLSRLGNPHQKLPPVIHIAGTNGKGSTQSYIKAIFEDAGYKVHSYTSPHLLYFNERITLASNLIEDDYLFEICERTRMAAETSDLQVTFFEGTTAAAFLAFSEVKADVVILETGMGGRVDSTNVIAKPAVTIITPISYDHMEYLGRALPIIACEKGGIIKPGVPCVISAQEDDVYAILSDICEKLRAPIHAFEYDFGVEKTANGFKILGIDLDDEEFPMPSLAGNHQIINASSSIVAISKLKNFNITSNNMKNGISNAKWPGRLQKIKDGLFADCAHNQGGAFVLSAWAQENLENDISLILGMTKNRNVLEFLEPFIGVISNVFCVGIKSEPSAYSADKLAELAAKSGINTIICQSLQEALTLSCAKSKNVIVTGSIYLIADLHKY